MDEFEWNVVNESHLLEAMVGHKPLGINKNFQMSYICVKFAEFLKKDVPSSKIWSQLSTMYNMDTLNDTEPLPFPNEATDFSLPDSNFATLKRKKEKDDQQEDKKPQKGRETPKNLKEIKSVKEEIKTPTNSRSAKNETPRRDSKDKDNGKETKTPIIKKEIKKEVESKTKTAKGRNSLAATKEDTKKKREESPRPVKRPTRGSLKPDETNSGKASPLTVTPAKRRRI